MKTSKILTTIALCSIAVAAYAGAIYLECRYHRDLAVRFASFSDCVEARSEHNLREHAGFAAATCRARAR
jgi:hypothetical protein